MTQTVIERFVEDSPITVMARLALQCALDPESIDGMFAQAGNGQQIRESLFSVTVELMSMIASGPRCSVRAAAGAPPELPVSITALHDRISRSRSGWSRGLVRDSVKRLAPLVQPLRVQPLLVQPLMQPLMQPLTQPLMQPMAGAALSAGGYRLRVVDGSHLPNSASCSPGPSGCVHTLMPPTGSRVGVRAAASFVVYDPEVAMIADLVSCEAGPLQEETIAEALLDSVQPGELWIVDRHFDTRAIVTGWQRRNSAFIVQDHGCGPALSDAGRLVKKGRNEWGLVYEQPVCTTDESGEPLALRRIEVHLDQPDAQGDRIIQILTNLPAAHLGAGEIVRLSCRRWSETLPVPLDLVFRSEIVSLGRPRAAPLALGVAALAYNVLSAMAGAVIQENELDARERQRLPHYMATSVRTAYAGMMIAVPVEFWQRYDQLAPDALCDILRKIAPHVDSRSSNRQRREPAASPETKAMLRAATLDVMLCGEAVEDPDDEPLSGLRFIAMATREFSSNPSKVLRNTAESPVMVTKYGQAIAFLISVEHWNRMKAERRETMLDRLAAGHTGLESAARSQAAKSTFN